MLKIGILEESEINDIVMIEKLHLVINRIHVLTNQEE